MKLGSVVLLSALGCAGAAHAQGWSPQRDVEIVVGFVPGGGMDRTARALDRIPESNKLVTSGVTVQNKPTSCPAPSSARPCHGSTRR
jgi:putative tricarboxylic transport membrane protein